MRKRALPLVLVLAGFLVGRLTVLAPALAQPPTPAPTPTAAPTGPSEDAPECARLDVPEGQPRYLAAMRDELTAMGVADAACEAIDAQRAHCRISHHGASTDREYEVNLAYSDVTDSIYIHVDRYLVAASDGAHTDAVMRRLMELNWTMLLGKFEWDPTDGEVRLATIVNTDSNFDRRAFRSAVRSLGALADRYYGELNRLVETGH
jgi:hypothetical protein